MKEQEKKDLQVELKSRKILKAKLEVAIRSLNKQVGKIVSDRQSRKEKLSQYKNENDLQDAYGWGFIDEDEYYATLEAMRSGVEAIESEKAAQEIAQEMLKGWLKITESDISAIEFDLLSDKKKEEIRRDNERILAEREKRRKEKTLKDECTGDCDNCKYAYYATDHGYAYEESKLHCKLKEKE
ncbi:MAG: hypothetical protein II777_10740 [Clostridia bacterium]|nr:hypothetical protein [Clostridia bacterium]